ncbi:MAG: hypothetical protein ABFC84_02515 [Veillonellales bacterium]
MTTYCFVCGAKIDVAAGKCTNSACPRYEAPATAAASKTSDTSTTSK